MTYADMVSCFQNKTTQSLSDRWLCLQSAECKGLRPWTQQEDEILRDLRGQGLNWARMVPKFDNRTKYALQSRWLLLRPADHKRLRSWTQQEDELIRGLKEQGLKWSQMAPRFNNRTVEALKARWARLKSEDVTGP